MMNNLSCSLTSPSDPWGAHIFGTELHIAKTGTPIPYLCADYTATVYSQCANVNINWPVSTSPFGGPIMLNKYPTEADFCNDYCAPDILNYCFR